MLVNVHILIVALYRSNAIRLLILFTLNGFSKKFSGYLDEKYKKYTE